MSIRFAFAVLTVIAVIPMALCHSGQQPPGKDLAKVIARLGAADFRDRERADSDLFQLGDGALLALRQAAKTGVPLETKRRIESLIDRIEGQLLEIEAKNWQTLDAPPYVKDCIASIMARKHLTSDAKCAEAIYLLLAHRRPTKHETEQALNEFKKSNSQTVSALRIARPLIRSSGVGVDRMAYFMKLVEAQKVPFPDAGNVLGEAKGRFSATFTINSLDDQDFAGLLYLFVLGRFPIESEITEVATLKIRDDVNRIRRFVEKLQNGSRWSP